MNKYRHTIYLDHGITSLFMHLVHFICIAVLILTGFYIYAPLSFNIFPSMDMARFLHFFFMYLIIFVEISKTYYNISRNEIKEYLFTWKDIKELNEVSKYYLFRTFLGEREKSHGRYNAGQKLLYTGWPLLMLIQTITGFAMYFTDTFSEFNNFFGGLNNMKALHLIISWIFLLTTLAHAYLGLTQVTISEYYKYVITKYKEKSLKKRGNSQREAI